MVWLALPLLASLLRSAEAQVAANTVVGNWHVTSGTTCSGSTTEYEACPGLPACGTCVPRHCLWAVWSDWQNGPGCTGVCTRVRNFTPSNECGNPCVGEMKATKQCLNPACNHTFQDCVWQTWGQWTTATGSAAMAVCADPLSQKLRVRTYTAATHGGTSCKGPSKETEACHPPIAPVDCSLSTWTEWTQCSVSCGSGRMSRLRRVLNYASHGGRACHNVTREYMRCNPQACNAAAGNVNCSLSDWSGWRGCDSQSPFQKRRTRLVVQEATGTGWPCSRSSTTEVSNCTSQGSGGVVCELSAWQDWQTCDRSCDGGQRFRHKIFSHPEGSGACAVGPVRMVQPCGTGPCWIAGTNDCKLNDWGEWNECSSKCGIGIRHRKRTETLAVLNGKGCGTNLSPDSLEEVAVCHDTSNCYDRDCRWHDWEDWGGCTDTCGGGTKRRHRYIDQMPEKQGRLCAAHPKYEIAPCATDACPRNCQNAEWGVWASWSKCSTTCGSGYQSRQRHLEKEATDCGNATNGLREEFQSCMVKHCVPPKDCEVGDWDIWAACTATCFGVQERTRVIKQYHQGEGKRCNTTDLREVQACAPKTGEAVPAMCNTLTPDKDCKLSPWEPWSACPVHCGTGQINRYRRIIQPNMHNGSKCDNVTRIENGQTYHYIILAQTDGCRNLTACPGDEKRDCKMGTWSEWGTCSKAGQRIRTREIVQFQDSHGQPCTETHVREMQMCDQFHGQRLYCIFGEWSQWDNSTCNRGAASCGHSTIRRHRSLGISTHNNTHSANILFQLSANDGAFYCSGTQEEQQPCPLAQNCTQSCHPINCEWQTWSDWSAPHPEGLCNSHRHMVKVNNHCGTPCSGPLIRTKSCTPRGKIKLDCRISEWGMWSQCSSPIGQRLRVRTIRQRPQNGGAECPLAGLRETEPCAKNSNPERDCSMTQWTAWGKCTKDCGAGSQIRTRRIDASAANGGALCNYSMEEVQACNTQYCGGTLAVDCKLKDWSVWGVCGQHGRAGQKTRVREILEAAQFGGVGCSGIVEETEPCVDPIVNCVLSGWTVWTPCSQTCQGGVKLRHRQVQTWPRNGGVECVNALNLSEVATCNVNTSCLNPADDCEFSQWSMWSDSVCSTTCGPGETTRGRKIIRERRGNGKGCHGVIQEVGTCTSTSVCPVEECRFNQWTEWDVCTKDCGGGQQWRRRSYVEPNKIGGKTCPAGFLEELRACNIHKCQDTCVDGTWDSWSPFAPCSRTCRGGTTWRNRLVKTSSNHCGKGPLGDSRQVAACNSDVACLPSIDCKLTDWDNWGACSQTCNGMKRRNRRVDIQGSGNGKLCDDALSEAAPCNPGTGGVLDARCPRHGQKWDCTLSVWSAWSACSKTCGGGQSDRWRNITNNSHGGGVCLDSLKETMGCNKQLCPTPTASPDPCGVVVNPIDCTWLPWSDWGACDKIGGQRMRMRHIASMAIQGGHNCEMDASKETEPCPQGGDQQYCIWGAWSMWSACSHTCGSGQRYHSRHLTLETMPASSRRLSSSEQRQRLYESHLDGGVAERQADFEERFHELYRQSVKDESIRRRQLIGAFASGSLGFLACMVLGMAVARTTGLCGAAGRRTRPPHLAADEVDAMSSAIE